MAYTWRKLIKRGIAIFIVSMLIFMGSFIAILELTPISFSKLTAAVKPTVVYDKNGAVYMTIGDSSSHLTYSQIPKNLQNAIVATEDHNFWNGTSIDLRGILRALFVDLWTRGATQGASTIQEQLAKIVYLNDNKSLSYKINQIVMGVQISRHFSKQQIMTMYLNRVFLGENSIGVEQAAMRYFGVDLTKNPNSLTLDEAALLAGLPQAPSAYDPLVHPQAALERRNEVLQNMLKYGYLTPEKAATAEKAPLGAKYHAMNTMDAWNAHPLFTNVLFDEAAKQGISTEQLLQGGLKIYTTVNPQVQQAVHTVFWNSNYNGDFPGSSSGTVVEGSAVFVDPKTGGILGAAGSRRQDYTRLGMDRIFSDSSPGSSIKSIMEYAPAIQSGNYTPVSILHDQPQDFGDGYVPQNWNSNAPAKVTLQYGLQWSQNVASVWLLKQIGIQTGAAFAQSDGIKLVPSDLNHLGIAIGGMKYGVNPVEMAQAYEPFDNQGVQMKVHLINSIVNSEDQPIYQFQPSAKAVMTSTTADIMTGLMQDVVDYGTGTSAQVPGWGVAGKTGTVQYSSGLTGYSNWVRDAWFDGYTPNIVGSIHIGYDETSAVNHMTMSPLDPSANAAKIFSDITRLAEEGIPSEQFNVGPYPASQASAASASTIGGSPASTIGTKQNNLAVNSGQVNNTAGNSLSGNSATSKTNTTANNTVAGSNAPGSEVTNSTTNANPAGNSGQSTNAGNLSNATAGVSGGTNNVQVVPSAKAPNNKPRRAS